MRIKILKLNNFCGYRNAVFNFGNFTCLYGPNGIGKTTVLNAISLLCTSLDFSAPMDIMNSRPDMVMTISPEARLRKFLEKNIRVSDGQSDKQFNLEGVFEHEGKEYSVMLNERGFVQNDIIKQPWWWNGLTYFTKFDTDMGTFILPEHLWPKFSSSYENITGIKIDPDFYDENIDGKKETFAINFWLNKPNGRIDQKKASAGEKKIAKALSQVVMLPPERLPHIALVDNLEMHVHYKRHLRMVDEIKSIFSGIQIIATTHSSVIIEQYEPKSDMIDVEDIINKGAV